MPLGSPHAKPYRAGIREYVAHLPKHILDGRGLYLYGEPQTGKQAAVAITLRTAILHLKKSVLWLEAESARTALYNREPFEADTTMAEYMRGVDLLAIAHLGDEKDHPDFKAMLAALIRSRRNYHRPTFLTSPLAPGLLLERYGSAVNNAIKSSCTPICCEVS